MIFILVTILAFLPAFFWFFIFLKEDRFDPEPKRLLIKLFILGGFSGLIAALLEFVFSSLFPGQVEQFLSNFVQNQDFGVVSPIILIFVIFAILIFAILEETVKITVVKEFAFYHSHFNQVVDGAIFGISAGLGFATLENLVYFAEATFSAGVGPLLIVFLLRFFASTLLHALTTGVAGYYLGKSKFSRNKSVFWQGLVAAILIHAAFNLFLFGGIIGIFFEIVFLMMMFVFLISRMESIEAQTIWRLVLFKDITGRQKS